MKNKKVLMAVASTALVAVVGIGATLAYFTDQAEAENIVTMGHVDIDLTEKSEDEDSVMIEDGLRFDNVMPGDVISKIPTITVADDSQNAYVRMKMEITTPEGSGITAKDLELLETGLRKNITNQTGWSYNDGYYYYNDALEATEFVDFFQHVDIPAEWHNNTADGSFTIKLQAEAIQEENVQPTKEGDLIVGWPEATIEEYTAK